MSLSDVGGVPHGSLFDVKPGPDKEDRRHGGASGPPPCEVKIVEGDALPVDVEFVGGPAIVVGIAPLEWRCGVPRPLFCCLNATIARCAAAACSCNCRSRSCSHVEAVRLAWSLASC